MEGSIYTVFFSLEGFLGLAVVGGKEYIGGKECINLF